MKKLDLVKMGVEAVESGVVGMRERVAEASMQSAAGGALPWTEVVKKGRKKKEKKNLLVLKATDDNVKAVNKKEEVSSALKGIRIQDSKFTQGGNVVMNVENEETLQDAAKKLEK